MPFGFLPLVGVERADECRELAEKTHRHMGNTMREAAQSHHANARSLWAAGRVAAGIDSGEKALAISESDEDWDLTGTVLVDLADAYDRAHRHRQQVRKLLRYLDTFDHLDEARCHEVHAWHSLGQALYQLGELNAAISYLTEAQAIALRQGALPAADHCRHLLRRAMLRTGRLENMRLLLEESASYLQCHPQDRFARCAYRYDLADCLLAGNQPAEAFERALEAMILAEGSTAHEVGCAVLLSRCAASQGRHPEAGSFLLLARLRALQGGRPCLAYDVTQQIDQLIREHGPSILQGVEAYFDGTGLNPFRYIPEHVK